jgi:hypothetical protein
MQFGAEEVARAAIASSILSEGGVKTRGGGGAVRKTGSRDSIAAVQISSAFKLYRLGIH